MLIYILFFVRGKLTHMPFDAHDNTKLTKELEKALSMLGELNDSQKKIIEELSKSVAENIISTPMNNLRKETEHGNSDLIDAASKLFNFKKEDN